MRASFSGHYRRMIPQLLELLEFRSNNDLHRPVIEALDLLKKYAHSKTRYYDSSEEIPIDGVLKSNAKEVLMETDSDGNERINRINYEISVLKALRERLCCKEIWVVGANRYRNPDDDLPTDFETKRQIYYQALTLPEDVETFISGLQQQMESGLEKLDKGMPKNKGVAIGGKGNKGLIRLSPFDALPDPINLRQLKGEINRLWHKTSLLDILKETDLRVDFTRSFKSMGTREILDRETLQKRLLLCLFGMGTNTGLKRINTGIDGVLRHCTSMEVKKNYVDSHGQSEVAFAVPHLLGFQLMPRLKRIKVQKLYRPHAGQTDAYPNLEPVMTRPINWDLIRDSVRPDGKAAFVWEASHTKRAVKYATALRLGTAETEAILKRFSKNPFKHPTYLALMELGRVIKTVFLCQYLDSEAIRREINEGLNVVERWNGVNEFIFYGKGGEFASNRLESQELSVLSLHLLQVCLVYVNTLMIQSVLAQEHWQKRLTARNLQAITPLIFAHVNPYGLFRLNMKERIESLSQPLVA